MKTGIVRSEVFGADDKPTIEYLVGYGSTIDQMKPHIRLLQLMGFRVVGFEYDKAILNAGDPSLLTGAIEEITENIEQDSRGHEVAGIYGISLGAYIGFNVLKRTSIDRAIFSTGGASILGIVWGSPYMEVERQKYMQAGHDKESMTKDWKEIDEIDKLADKKILMMVSTGDSVIPADESIRNFHEWTKQGTEGKLLKTSRLNHGQVIFINLFRLKRTRDFFIK